MKKIRKILLMAFVGLFTLVLGIGNVFQTYMEKQASAQETSALENLAEEPKVIGQTKWQITTTTGDLVGRDGYQTDVDAIRGLYEAGFRYIDLSMYRIGTSIYMQDNWREEVQKLKAVADELGMKFVQAHSPGDNPLSSDFQVYDYVVDYNIRSIEVCGELGIENIVVHAGFINTQSKAQWFAANKAFYDRILPTAERCGVNVLCENSTRKNLGNMYYIYTGLEMREFIKYVNHPNFHGCWDTGHAHCEGGSQYDDILALGEEMYAIHYAENMGNADSHLLPYCGSLNNEEVIQALIDSNFEGYFTLECDASTRGNSSYNGPQFDWMLEAYPGYDLSEIPEHMTALEQEKLLYQLADYIIHEYSENDGKTASEKAFNVLASESSYSSFYHGTLKSVSAAESTVTVSGGKGAYNDSFSGFMLTKEAISKWISLGFEYVTFTVGLSSTSGTAPKYADIYIADNYADYFETQPDVIDGVREYYYEDGKQVKLNLPVLNSHLADNQGLQFVFIKDGVWTYAGEASMTFSNVVFEKGSAVLSETKYKISDDGTKMLLVTAIKNVENVYEVGYEFSGEYSIGENAIAETKKYYTSITTSVKQEAVDIFGFDFIGAKLIIWEVPYAEGITCNAYAKEGVRVNGELTIPATEIKIIGETKELSGYPLSQEEQAFAALVSGISKEYHGQPTSVTANENNVTVATTTFSAQSTFRGFTLMTAAVQKMLDQGYKYMQFTITSDAPFVDIYNSKSVNIVANNMEATAIVGNEMFFANGTTIILDLQAICDDNAAVKFVFCETAAWDAYEVDCAMTFTNVKFLEKTIIDVVVSGISYEYHGKPTSVTANGNNITVTTTTFQPSAAQTFHGFTLTVAAVKEILDQGYSYMEFTITSESPFVDIYNNKSLDIVVNNNEATAIVGTDMYFAKGTKVTLDLQAIYKDGAAVKFVFSSAATWTADVAENDTMTLTNVQFIEKPSVTAFTSGNGIFSNYGEAVEVTAGETTYVDTTATTSYTVTVAAHTYTFISFDSALINKMLAKGYTKATISVALPGGRYIHAVLNGTGLTAATKESGYSTGVAFDEFALTEDGSYNVRFYFGEVTATVVTVVFSK